MISMVKILQDNKKNLVQCIKETTPFSDEAIAKKIVQQF
jgi:predicted transcriptional regulator